VARTGLPSFLGLLMFPWCDDSGIEILLCVNHWLDELLLIIE